MNKFHIIGAICVCLVVGGAFWWWQARQPRAQLGGTTVSGAAGEIIEIPIVLDTKGQVINAAEAYLTYNPSDIQVVEATKNGSLFEVWIDNQPAVSQDKGTVSFAGGVPSPGFSGKGQIGTLKVKGKKSGTTSIRFESSTQVLLNDGQGTAMPIQLDPIQVRIK